MNSQLITSLRESPRAILYLPRYVFWPSLLLALVLCLSTCSSEREPEPVTWIDVRTPAEYAEKHVPQASNIPHTEIVAGVAQLNLAKDAPIYLYCKSGRRAGLAQEALEAEGYSNVTNLGSLDDALQRAE